MNFSNFKSFSLSGNKPLWTCSIDGELYFIKADKPLSINTIGIFDSSICEIVCYRLGKQLRFDVIETSHTFIDIKGINTLVTYTKNFSRNFGSIPMTNIIDSIDYDRIKSLIASLNNKTQKKFYEMLLFDFIIGNNDRHTSNIEFYLNRDFNIHDLVPIFDNGNSLNFIKDNVNTPSYRINDYIINNYNKSISYMPYQIKENDLLSLIDNNIKGKLLDVSIDYDEIFRGLEFLDNFSNLKNIFKLYIDNRLSRINPKRLSSINIFGGR